MTAAIKARLEKLVREPYSTLAALPEWETENLVVEGVNSELITYREGNPGETLKVVVQFNSQREPFLIFFKTSQVKAEGFEVSKGGEVTILQEADLYDFM